MKKLFIFTFFLLAMKQVSAQNGQVSGLVLDDHSVALPFANVLLLQASDSSLVKAVTSSETGRFELNDLPLQSYLLRISSVGFQDFHSPKFELSRAAPNFSLPPLKLLGQANVLKEVQVVAKKPFIEQQLDKTVLNVENSIVASGNTALEVLEKAPGVTVDRQSEVIKLKGKDGVLVMIDGRKNYMSNEALIQFLNNMTSDQIASIELITNPSSKYEASGNSGIINIKLKKNQAFGTNGTVSLAVGNGFIPGYTGDLFATNANLNLNHRNEKWNLFGNANLGRSGRYRYIHIARSTSFEGLRSEFDQVSTSYGSGVFASGKVGADYFLSSKTTLGLMLDASNWDARRPSTGLTKITEYKEELLTTSSLIPDSDQKTDNFNLTGNFNIKHNFNEKGKELTFDMDYNRFDNIDYQYFDTKYFNTLGERDRSLIQQSNMNTAIDIYASRVDFVLPTATKWKFETGAKVSYVKTDNDIRFDYLEKESWIVDPGKTNRFVYTEMVNAAYANVGKQWGKIGLQAGLRAEHTHSVANSIVLKNTVVRNYLNFFPTAFLNHKLGKNHALRYSYSRRIGRPNYQQLNPFLFFLDPFTFERGNEYLTPQFTDNIEIAYTFKDASSLSLSYARTADNIIGVIQQDDKTRVTYYTTKNLQKGEHYSANLSFPIPVAKWWNMHNNASVYYGHFFDPEVSGGRLDMGRWAYNFYTSSTFTLQKGWSAEANMWYDSPSLFGNVRRTKPQFAVNAGVQKSFWGKKANLKLNVNDIFLTSFFNGAIDHENVNLRISNRWVSRKSTLTFTYNFGNQKRESQPG